MQKQEKSLTDFLEWFIGLIEGNGFFGFSRGRPYFCINQADLPVLEYIKQNLGFGMITTLKQKGTVYARYIVTNKNSIESFINYINGNLFLKKLKFVLKRGSNALIKNTIN
jgi:hypothetical protein